MGWNDARHSPFNAGHTVIDIARLRDAWHNTQMDDVPKEATMATKKPIDTVREELRVLNSAADDANTTNLLSWLTPEFWTMAIGAIGNLVTVGVLLGWVSQSQAEDLTKAVTALVGASQVIVLNTVLIWKYLTGRQELRAQMIDARYRYMEAVAVERLRADR